MTAEIVLAWERHRPYLVVTSRLCLDQIKSARARRERPHDAADLAAVPATGLDPADRVTLDDSVGLALLVVLQRLTPAERVVFVLHDIFRLTFDEVADTVGRSPHWTHCSRGPRSSTVTGSGSPCPPPAAPRRSAPHSAT